MKQTSKIVGFMSTILLILLAIKVLDSQEINLESEESKTADGSAVFNKIKLIQRGDLDVWMMNQSHHGPVAKDAKWDRLAIVIDKTKSPKTARFYQLNSGSLDWDDDKIEVPYKVSCFICHSNGTRVIRPNYESPENQTTFLERIKIFYWNIKIKLYGRVIPDPEHKGLDRNLKIPFRWRGSYANETLNVKTCVMCHKESGFLAKGLLRRQHLPAIKSMLKRNHMPPLGMTLSSEEKEELQKFLIGF